VQGNFFFNLFSTIDHCRRIEGSDTLYETVSVLGLLSRRNQRVNGDVVGKCGKECAKICNHKPCFRDYLAVDENTCECFKGVSTKCGQAATCDTAGGNETCLCSPGYALNASGACSDINECAVPRAQHPCPGNTTCFNTPGSFECSCLPGFALNNGTCLDIDECANGACPGAVCTNTVGNFTCGKCQPGFRGNPPAEPCVDINECDAAPCLNGTCTNTPGSYSCSCSAGFNLTGGGTRCVDINECTATPPVCRGTGISCVNEPGSYRCVCRSGFTLTGNTCTDVNECLLPNTCPGTNCTNTIGSFSCSKCLPGYQGNPPATPCTDIDECERLPCSPNGLCSNTDGGYTCECSPGYKSIAPDGGCVDRDECEEDPNLCPLETTRCRNTVGSFACRCINGFNGTDGKCTQIYDFDEFQPCQGNDCKYGLDCVRKSRSDSTKVCCVKSNVTTCGGDQKCCSGAYRRGEECPSKLDIDCRGALKCGFKNFLDRTHICCPLVRVNPLNGNKFCLRF
jgi:Calcium-binding EGF domain